MEVTTIFQKTLPNYFDDYELRPQQIEMAELVKEVIDGSSHAVIEGTTGVGKSFAYLIPSLVSGKKITVSTANKNLQDQLSQKDLPFLQEIFKKSFKKEISWATLKGKNNYFCWEKFQINKKDIQKKWGRDLINALSTWYDETEDGDLNNIEFHLPSEAKRMICCDNDTKHEKGTAGWLQCKAVQARMNARDVDIILVNHSLLALDKAVKLKTEGEAKILPDSDVIILDEAHTFSKMAGLAFSDELNVFSLRHYFGWPLLKSIIPRKKKVDPIIKEFEALAETYKPEMGDRGYYKQEAVEKFEGFSNIIDGLKEINELVKNASRKPKYDVESDEEFTEKKKQIYNEGKSLISRLERFSKYSNDDIKWTEARDTKRHGPLVTLKVAPLDVGEQLREVLFKGNTVIATSATLAVNDKFDYFKDEIGAPENTRELITESPFDFAKNCLLYFTTGAEQKINEIDNLLNASKGRALVLFTSYKAMQEAYNFSDVKYEKFIQSYETSKYLLLQRFLDSDNGVLFATKSFWEGIDIKGEKLSMVIIDKIPFPNVNDLLFSKKCESVDKKHGKDGASFYRLSVPEACLALKQGAGRLIRSKNDRGVIALLDPRINYANYKKPIVRSFPPKALRTQKMENVKKFYAEV